MSSWYRIHFVKIFINLPDRQHMRCERTVKTGAVIPTTTDVWKLRMVSQIKFGDYKSKAVTLHAMATLGEGGERKYSSYSFLTSALDGCEWSAARPGRSLPQGKDPPVSIAQKAGWASELVWTQRLEEKSFAPAEDRTPIARSSSS
jgi:hypothetical protein